MLGFREEFVGGAGGGELYGVGLRAGGFPWRRAREVGEAGGGGGRGEGGICRGLFDDNGGLPMRGRLRGARGGGGIGGGPHEDELAFAEDPAWVFLLAETLLERNDFAGFGMVGSSIGGFAGGGGRRGGGV